MNNTGDKDEVMCPKCGSTKLHAEKRGWSIWVGFIGSGKIVVTCIACGHRFRPGEGVVGQSSPKPTEMKKPDDDQGIPTYNLD
jgi:predicted RNA-binding Zn-ribbon protein involved in translation (DUF1610 family)